MSTSLKTHFTMIVAAGAVGVSALAAQAPQIALLGKPQLWQRAEFRVTGTPTAENNFDPDQIRLDATFTTPSGEKLVVPAFWFQDFTHAKVNGAEVLTAAGTPEWRIRFTPTEPGEFVLSLAIQTAGNAAAAAPVVTRFTVAPAGPREQHGWVRVAADKRYFETSDGRPLRLIGENVCWPESQSGAGTYDYDAWFGGMQKAGENFARLWLCPWGIGLEHEPGTLNRYKLEDAWQLDAVFQLAERSGIYLLLCFDHHGMFFVDDPGWGGSNNFWRSSNPYGAPLGGPCATPGDFFTNEQARSIYQKRLRYLVGRYGYSPNLLAWQFFNEIDNAYPPRSNLNGEAVVAWHREMGRWFDAHDPFRHLVTTSLTGGSIRPEMWEIPEMDFSMYHSYSDPAPGRKAGQLAEDFVQRFKKPAMIGEFGTSARDWNIAADPHLRGFRQALWGGALGGSVGTAMSWWWEDIHTDNAYPLYSAMNDILRRAGWHDGVWTPIAGIAPAMPPNDLGEPIADGVPFNAPLALNSFWRLTFPGEAAIANRLAAERSSELLSSILWGTDATQYERRIKLTAHFGAAARVVLKVNAVGATTELVVTIDGAEALRAPLADTDGKPLANGEINREFPITVAPGRHVIEITHPGAERVLFDSIRLERVLPAEFAGGWKFTPEIVGLRNGPKAVLYLYSPHVVYPAGALRYQAPVQAGQTLTLPDWPAGRFRAQWFDPIRGQQAGSTMATTQNGKLTFAVPEFAEDLAVIVAPAPVSS